MTAAASRRGRVVLAALVTSVAVLAAESWIRAQAASAPVPRPYQTAGQPVTGGADPVAGPMLAPGRYVDTFDTADASPTADGAGKYYRVRLHKGDTPYVSATEVPPAHADDGTTPLTVAAVMKPVDARITSCSFTETGYGGRYADELNTVTVVLTPGEVAGPGWRSDCPTDAVYSVQIVRIGNAYKGETLAGEIAFRLEPPANSSGLPTPARAQANVRARTFGTTTKVTGGTGFNDAPLLPPGQYSERFTSGETRYFRVHLDWGQRLAYTVTAEQNPNVADLDGADGHTAIANPLRAPLIQPDRAHTTESFLGSIGGAMYGSSLVPVRYANRNSDDPNVNPYAIDGDYYLALATDFSARNKPTISIAYTLAVDVVGAKERGPDYAQVHASTAPPASSSNSSRRSASRGSSSWIPQVVLGGSVAAALALGAAVLVRRRRRRRRRRRPAAAPHTRPVVGRRAERR